MCLITTQKVPTIADKDVTTYKAVSSYRGFIRPLIYSHNVVYKIGELYETEIKITRNKTYANNEAYTHYEGMIINNKINSDSLIGYGNGFHSSKDPRQIRDYLSITDNTILMEFMIPAGAHYYEDDLGNVVSNMIVPVGPIDIDDALNNYFYSKKNKNVPDNL